MRVEPMTDFSSIVRWLTPQHWLAPDERATLEAWGYLVALVAAELVTNLVEPRAGLVLYALILAGLLVHTAFRWEQPIHRLLLSLTFVPLIRILSLSLPLTRFPQIDGYLFTSIPLFLMAFMVMRTLGLSRRAVGLTWRGLPLQLAIGLTGLALGYIEYLILSPQPLIGELSWQQFWLPALILLVSTGLLEELLFRGIMQRTALDALRRGGMVYVAALFAALHVGHRSAIDILFVFGVGIFFGWVAARTGSIVGVTLSHGLTNIMLFLVVPLLIPHLQAPVVIQLAAEVAPEVVATPAAVSPAASVPTAVSPDGKWQVTTAKQGAGTWLLAIDGTAARQLSPVALAVSWAPNSLGYAYADEHAVYAIGVWPDSQPLMLGRVEAPARIVAASVAWAPIGNQIAFEVDEGDGETALRLVSSAGGVIRTLDRGQTHILTDGSRGIQWSADARELLWTSVSPARRLALSIRQP